MGVGDAAGGLAEQRRGDAGRAPDVSAEIQARWDALLPDWYIPVHYACEAGMLVAIVAVGLLLAQTSAHEFYELSRRVAEDDPRLWDIKRRS
ncbi:MAG TPA: hypothetical protein VFM54_00840 [Micromonosporaceae bacterium]|nr:hypothetical protein [Micromonosporaceae bacterium]